MISITLLVKNRWKDLELVNKILSKVLQHGITHETGAHICIVRLSDTKSSCLAGSRDIPCAWLSLICFLKHSHKLTSRSSVLLDSPSLGQENSLLYVPNRLGPVIWLGDTDERTCCGATLWQADWWSLTRSSIDAVGIRLWGYLIVLWLFHLACILCCGGFNLFCHVWECVCCGFCNVWVIWKPVSCSGRTLHHGVSK